MRTLPSISDALDERMVTSVINKKFNNFVPAFYKFVSEWIINAYSNFKDIEMYMILIYFSIALFDQTIYFPNNGWSWDTSYV